MAAPDRSAPGVRVVVLPDATAAEGRRVDIIDGRVMEFVFDEDDDKADRFTLSLRNNDLALFESGEDVLPGSTLEVSWGYPGNFSPPRRFEVKKISGRDPVKVEGVALSIQAHRQTKTRSWHGKRRSEVAAEIAKELGYEGGAAVIDDTVEVIDTINQMAETDARLLKRMALVEHFDFWIDDTGFHFHPRRADQAPTHVFIWYADQTGTITDWTPESNLIRRVGAVTVKGRDPVEKKDIEAKATGDSVDRPTLASLKEVVDPETRQTRYEEVTATAVEHSTTATTKGEAQREADARFRKGEREAVKIKMTVVGDPTLRAKAVIECRGLSTMFSGKYYVASCRHTIRGEYTCDMTLNRDGLSRRPGGSAGAAKASAAQGGQHNQNGAKAPGEVERVERVDRETNSTSYEYRRDGQVVGTEDPEAGVSR